MKRREFLRLLMLGGLGSLVSCSSVLKSAPREYEKRVSSIDTLILDFDGTLTNIEEETKAYVEGFRHGLGKELKLAPSELEAYWNEAEAKILKNPEKYGWELEGIIVASATSDPIMTCYPITDEILGKLGIALSPQERRALL